LQIIKLIKLYLTHTNNISIIL